MTTYLVGSIRMTEEDFKRQVAHKRREQEKQQLRASMEDATAEQKGDPRFMMSVVSRCGNLLEFGTEQIKGTKDIVIAAVKDCPWAINFASDGLQIDRDVVASALQSPGYHPTNEYVPIGALLR